MGVRLVRVVMMWSSKAEVPEMRRSEALYSMAGEVLAPRIERRLRLGDGDRGYCVTGV
jgi:hypothetical protein